MGFNDIINAVLNRREEKKAAFTGDFDDLVLRLADDEEIGHETIERVLKDAGKSVEDLREAVERIVNRRQWTEQLKALPILKKQVDELSASIKADDAAHVAAVNAYKRKKEREDARLLGLQMQLGELEAIRLQICETHDPQLNGQIAILGKRIYRLQREIEDDRKLEREREGHHELYLNNFRRLGQKVDPTSSPYWVKLCQVRELIEQKESQIAEIKEQIEEIEAQKAVIE